MRIGLVAAILFIPSLASAEIVTVYFSGEFNTPNPADPSQQDPIGLWESVGVVPGKFIWGSFQYDTTTTNGDQSPDLDSYGPPVAFTVNGLSADFTVVGTSMFAATRPSGFDDWQLIGQCGDFVPSCGIALAAVGDLGIQNTDPTASGYVGVGSGHPIFVPDLNDISGGSIAYVVNDPELGFVISIAGFSIEASSEPPIENIIGNIVDQVFALNTSNGVSNSLDAKLDAALGAVDDINENNDVAAVNSLLAFINAVEAQRGGMIEEDEACGLIQAADSIIVLLGGVSSGSTCLTQP